MLNFFHHSNESWNPLGQMRDAGFRWIDSGFRQNDAIPPIRCQLVRRSNETWKPLGQMRDGGFHWMDSGFRQNDGISIRCRKSSIAFN